jgi:glycosyltransferase involved in cell wall biosynthesis
MGGENDMIDVAMITKNSATDNPVFERVLDRLFEEVPVNNFILVDAKSTDDTFEIISRKTLEHKTRLIPHICEGNRAVARQIAIESVETDWFLFLDDDVILGQWWWHVASMAMNVDKVGLVWGWDRIVNKHSRNRMKVMYYLRREAEFTLMNRNFRNRGGLHDTLIRKKAIENVKIPPDLHVFEDWYIMEYVKRQGYYAITIPSFYCYHHLNPKFTLKNMTEIARLEKKYGLKSAKTVLFHFLMAIPKAALILLTSLDLKAAIDQFKMYAYIFLGRFLYG